MSDTELKILFSDYMENEAPLELDILFKDMGEKEGIILQECFHKFAVKVANEAPKKVAKALPIDDVISRFINDEIIYNTFSNGANKYKITITHVPSGIAVDNVGVEINSLYKTKQILLLKLYAKLLLNGL